MRPIESAAPDGPLETVVLACQHCRVSSPSREETPTEAWMDPGLSPVVLVSFPLPWFGFRVGSRSSLGSEKGGKPTLSLPPILTSSLVLDGGDHVRRTHRHHTRAREGSTRA